MQCANAIWEILKADAEELGLSCDKLHAATEHVDNLLESDDPGIKEALNGPNAKQWQCVMDEEIAMIEKNSTWKLVNPPSGTNIICLHFILKVKHDEKGEVSCYKAWLVANGNMQCESIDFNEIFTAVAKLPSVGAVLKNVASQGWKIHQIDVKNACLNAELTETSYMHPLPRYLKPG